VLLTVAPRRHVVVASWFLPSLSATVHAAWPARIPDRRDVAGALFNEAFRLVSPESKIARLAQLPYGAQKSIVRNQCVTAPVTTTKIAITKLCGRVLIGQASSASSRASPEPMAAQSGEGIFPNCGDCGPRNSLRCIGKVNDHLTQGGNEMTWKTPKIVEIAVGLEINMYACAIRK
jgi:coenzyme PQQ precursor peptide PqqA